MRISDWSSDVCSSDLPPLYLHLAAQLDHAVCWDLEKLHRAFGTPAHPREQPFAPQRHPGLVGRSEQFLPPEEEAGGYHVERPANAIERSQFTRNVDVFHEAVVQHHAIEAVPRVRSEKHPSELQSLM